MNKLGELNGMPAGLAKEEFLRCCGSTAWAERMAAGRPYRDVDALLESAGEIWNRLGRADWLEAFSHHPRIGAPEVLKAKFDASAGWAGEEQVGVRAASGQVLEALAAGNREYESKFGFVFLVCATGKTAPEMLDLLRARLGNDAGTETKVAAGEQEKITRLRLEKLLAAQT